MATIEKLMLNGLRSFGPAEEDTQKIKFSSPLTLFLGENGCGKTTIIEALKFACSGDIPGGSKSGQGFVNDPKLSNRMCTKGQVRLSLKDPKGNKYLVIKSVQVQNKGVTSSFKRLDSTLKKMLPDGTPQLISSRCVEIDNEICDILGVSKAILNNVVFCHQEDAYWPLEEPKKLKEKFDEIFGSTEYNRCAESIRKMIKEKETEIKIQESKVGMLKQVKEIVDRKNSDLNEKKEKNGRLEEVIKEKKERITPLDSRLREIADLETNLAKLQADYTRMEATKNALVEQQKTIRSSINSLFSGDDEELRAKIDSFEAQFAKIREKLAHCQHEKVKIEREQAQLSQTIDRSQIKLGKLQAAKKQHELTLAQRNNNISNAGEKLNLSVDTEDSKGAIAAIQTHINSAEEDYEALTIQYDIDESQLQEKIDECREKLAKAKHDIESKGQLIKDMKNKSREIDSQLRELDYSDEQLKSLESKIARVDNDLKTAKESFNPNEVTQSIERGKQRIRELEESNETLEREHKILLQNNVTEAELETQRHEIVKREAEIHKLKNKHFDILNSIFGEETPNAGFIKKAVDNVKQFKTGNVNELNKKITNKQKESTTLESKCRFQKDKLQSLEKELEQNETKFIKVTQGKPFDLALTELQQELEILQKNKGQLSSAKIMYEKFVSDFQKEKPCCPLCKTDFNGQLSATNEIIRNIKNKIAGIPKQLQDTAERLKVKQDEHDKLLQMKPVHEKIAELKEKLIPITTSEKQNFESFYARVDKELNELKEQIKEPQVVIDNCNKVIGDVALIDQHQIEINNSKRKVQMLEAQIVQVSSNRSRQQTEAELEKNKLELSTVRRDSETANTRLRQHSESCQQLREQRSRHVEQQLQIQKAMQGKPQLQEQLAELSDKELVLKQEIEELGLLLIPLRSELKEAETTRDTTKNDNREKLKQMQQQLSSNKKLLDDIKKLQKDIDSYVATGVDASFLATVEELADIKKQNMALETNKTNTLEKINEINKQIASQDGGLRDLNDNLLLRQKKKEEEKLQGDIKNLKRQIGDHNYRTILEEKRRLQEEKEEYSRQISQCVGQTDILKQEIVKIGVELNTSEYKNAYANYKKALITHVVIKDGAKNLHLFLRALEYGILKFHQERMDQINKIIRKLWRSIYRGNDCDYIEIKTDETKATGLRRSYNYKVVQIKSDVEIEMRGRCSAGQKVLACLIIRMALAETFSKNCGILALDEPTTNLDRSNIQSLSTALAKIVNARQEEKNFQLLIITHDEEFIHALSRVDKVDYFWKVSRNERGNSVVTKTYDL
ncbi:hypothetical protein PPYR_09822 [Photinus pyralis]|uniref:DNA repair protein RAD50 n=1 Tax=Photinus pyralis TaxID=7054 RepID=A0A1Y1NDK3_PHOPY|nr:DNA repair protein RAD50 [Photinus pyralis]KAB0795761.1 hypothetical protein PPYR_09822 [Photinus pyralis]